MFLIVDSFDETGERVFYNQFVTFVVGAGGFRGKRSTDLQKVRQLNNLCYRTDQNLDMLVHE